MIACTLTGHQYLLVVSVHLVRHTASVSNALVRLVHRGAKTWHGLRSAPVPLVPSTCPGVEEEGISSLFKGCSSVKQLGALLVAVELILSSGKPLALLQ